MKYLKNFLLPFSGLKNGIHLFDYQIDNVFFECFEDSIIQNGKVRVHLKFDKRPSFFVLNFDFEGYVEMNCDRCLEDFEMPLNNEQQFIVRLSEIEKEDEEEVVYIKTTDTEINIATFIYEIIHLNLPMRKVCEDGENGNPDCNENMFGYISEISEDDKTKDEGNSVETTSSVWSALKDLKVDK